MKVLHIITGLGVGGAEQQLRLLLRQLPAEAECEVVTLTEPGAVAEGIRADGTRVTHLGMHGNRDLTALPRLTGLIRAGRYDLVHTHLYRACVYGRLAARIAGVRAIVATEHSLNEDEIEGRPVTAGVRALYMAAERLGSTTVAVSGSVERRLRRWGVPAARLHTVPNGIDARRFRFDPAARAATRARLGIPADAFVVGGVGRLVPGKRFGALIEAVAGLPGALLLLAGTGPEHSSLRARAAQLGAADRVRLLGEWGDGLAPTDATPPPGPFAQAGPTQAHARQTHAPQTHAPQAHARQTHARQTHAPQAHARQTRGQARPATAPDEPWGAPDEPAGAPGIPQLLAALDVFVSPSAEESFGLAVLEALASGLPVLYASCPAVEDLPRGEAPGARRVAADGAELAARLTAALGEYGPGGPPAGAARLAVPPVVDRYDIARSAEALMTIYRATAGRPGGFVSPAPSRPSPMTTPSALTTR
jgi:glycosyltransferase involved in cell wall biosynthesis